MLLNGTSALYRMDPSATVMANVFAIGSLLDHLLLTYFGHFFAVCFIRTRADRWDHCAPIPTVIVEVVDGQDIWDFERALAAAVELGCQSFVVTESTAGAFMEAFLPVHDAAIQRTVPKRLLMVLQPNSSVFPTIPRMYAIEEIPDVLILLPSETTTEIELYTVELHDGDPITVVPQLIDVIGNNTATATAAAGLAQVDHFPDKFSNMNGRRLRLGTIPYLPNAHVADVPLGEGNARYISSVAAPPNVSALVGGTELWLVVLFCKMANCTTEVMMATEWGTVLENGTKFGLIGLPAMREVDIVISGLYTWYSFYQYLAFTAVHSRSGCTCLVMKPRLVSNWRTPFQSFPGSLWVAVFVAFLAGAFALLVVSRFRQRILALHSSARLTASDSVLLMIGFFMEQTVPMPHELAASCLLYGTLMFAGFMIGSSYNGGLASTMIVPQYEQAIDNVHELAMSRTTWVGVTVSWIYSILLAHQPDLRALRQTFREWDEEEIDRHAFDRDVAIIVERMEYGHFAHPRIDPEAMRGRRMLTDDIYWESVVGMSTKTWPARARFDRLVLDLKANGILAHWELIGVIKYLSLTTQHTIRYSRDSRTGTGDEFTPLRVTNVTGALLILGTGLSLAAMMFVAELLWNRVGRLVSRRFNTLPLLLGR